MLAALAARPSRRNPWSGFPGSATQLHFLPRAPAIADEFVMNLVGFFAGNSPWTRSLVVIPKQHMRQMASELSFLSIRPRTDGSCQLVAVNGCS